MVTSLQEHRLQLIENIRKRWLAVPTTPIPSQESATASIIEQVQQQHEREWNGERAREFSRLRESDLSQATHEAEVQRLRDRPPPLLPNLYRLVHEHQLYGNLIKELVNLDAGDALTELISGLESLITRGWTFIKAVDESLRTKKLDLARLICSSMDEKCFTIPAWLCVGVKSQQAQDWAKALEVIQAGEIIEATPFHFLALFCRLSKNETVLESIRQRAKAFEPVKRAEAWTNIARATGSHGDYLKVCEAIQEIPDPKIRVEQTAATIGTLIQAVLGRPVSSDSPLQLFEPMVVSQQGLRQLLPSLPTNWQLEIRRRLKR